MKQVVMTCKQGILAFPRGVTHAFQKGELGWVPLAFYDEQDSLLWQIELNACVEESQQLMGRLGNAQVEVPLLLISTLGEHWRGATKHRPKTHILDLLTGQTLWVIDQHFAPGVICTQDMLYLLEQGPKTILHQYARHGGNLLHKHPLKIEGLAEDFIGVLKLKTPKYMLKKGYLRIEARGRTPQGKYKAQFELPLPV